MPLGLVTGGSVETAGVASAIVILVPLPSDEVVPLINVSASCQLVMSMLTVPMVSLDRNSNVEICKAAGHEIISVSTVDASVKSVEEDVHVAPAVMMSNT